MLRYNVNINLARNPLKHNVLKEVKNTLGKSMRIENGYTKVWNIFPGLKVLTNYQEEYGNIAN